MTLAEVNQKAQKLKIHYIPARVHLKADLTLEVKQKALNLKTKSPLIPAEVILRFHLTVLKTFLMNLEMTLVEINQKAQLRYLIQAKLHLILHLTVKKVTMILMIMTILYANSTLASYAITQTSFKSAHKMVAQETKGLKQTPYIHGRTQ